MRQILEQRSGLSPEKIDTLCAFGRALLEKNQVMNLTAITEPQAVAELHFLDSIALLQAVDFQNQRVIDIGCGAGFPGVPLKIAEPSMELTLLDSLSADVEKMILSRAFDGIIVHGGALTRPIASLLIARRFPHIVICLLYTSPSPRDCS